MGKYRVTPMRKAQSSTPDIFSTPPEAPTSTGSKKKTPVQKPVHKVVAKLRVRSPVTPMPLKTKTPKSAIKTKTPAKKPLWSDIVKGAAGGKIKTPGAKKHEQLATGFKKYKAPKPEFPKTPKAQLKRH